MANKHNNLYLLTPADIKRMRKLVRTLDRALAALVELKRLTTLDDQTESFPPHESDLIEEASFLEYQLTGPFKDRHDL